jgi:outer membrane protein OmpA-like peptidoglycan-associated protein
MQMKLSIKSLVILVMVFVSLSACKTDKPTAVTSQIKPEMDKRTKDSIARAEIIAYDPAKLEISSNLPAEVQQALRNLEQKKFTDGNLGEQLIGFAKVGAYDFADKFKFLILKFTRDEAGFQESSAMEIDELAEVMNQFPKMEIVIEAHMNNDLAAAKSLAVSQGRADAIKAKLVSKGISEARIKAVGFGQKFPVADNAKHEGKLINERVEIQLMKFI